MTLVADVNPQLLSLAAFNERAGQLKVLMQEARDAEAAAFAALRNRQDAMLDSITAGRAADGRAELAGAVARSSPAQTSEGTASSAAVNGGTHSGAVTGGRPPVGFRVGPAPHAAGVSLADRIPSRSSPPRRGNPPAPV